MADSSFLCRMVSRAHGAARRQSDGGPVEGWPDIPFPARSVIYVAANSFVGPSHCGVREHVVARRAREECAGDSVLCGQDIEQLVDGGILINGIGCVMGLAAKRRRQRLIVAHVARLA